MRSNRYRFGWWRDERGSSIAQAAAVAALSALLIGALAFGSRQLSARVAQGFGCLIASLVGGDATCSGDAPSSAPDAPIVIADPVPSEPPTPPPFAIERANLCELTVLFSQYEDTPNPTGRDGTAIPHELLEKYQTNPDMMAYQRNLIDELATHAQNGGAPLTPEQVYQRALAQTQDPGTALLVAHNALKALARGSDSIGWTKVSNDPLVYRMDGKEYQFDDADLHPDAEPTANGNNSAFYRMVSPAELGTNDPGDWYHFFLEATMSYYSATGRIDSDTNGLANTQYGSTVCGTLNGVADQMKDPNIEDSDAYRAWRRANALSFLEGGLYGGDYADSPEQAQQETSRETNLHRRGTLFGLEIARVDPDERWRWFVPKSGSIQPIDGVFGVDVPDHTDSKIKPDGTPE
jgi:hypothetical protein